MPAGRNRLAAGLIRAAARGGAFAGFSSDLAILHENSRAAEHDGREGAFYQTLKSGAQYGGYYAAPFREIAGIYRDLQQSGGSTGRNPP